MGARKAFLEFTDTLPLPNPTKHAPGETDIVDKISHSIVWSQFLMILKFWAHDDSKGFERTDVFIEKNLRFGYELTNTNLMESMIDLGKFLMNK